MTVLGGSLRDPCSRGVLLCQGEPIHGRHPALISLDLLQRVLASSRVGRDHACGPLAPEIEREDMKEFAVRDERLLDLVADGDLPTGEVRARLAEVQLERRALSGRLDSAARAIAQRIQVVTAQLKLLRDPAALHADAPDLAPRSFFDAFFVEVTVEISEEGVAATKSH